MFDPSRCTRIDKLVAGREARDQLDIREPVAENVHRLAKATAIMAASPRTGIDMLIGLGGTAEAVIAACAVKCLGGVLQGRLAP